MNSSELRARAREKLKGFWGLALGVALVAALLGAGGGSSSGSFVNLVYRLQNQYGDTENARQIIDQLAPLALMGASVAGLAGMVQFVLGGPVTLGLKTFFLNLDRGKPAKFEDLFSQFQNFLNGFLLQLLTSLFILLWALLLIVPGIIAGFSYAMAPYLMADNPALGPMEAIRASKEMMKGHKFELFCLGLSFIGWALLCLLTLGIGDLWLTPYMEASNAAFYDNLKAGTAQTSESRPYQGPEF
jgi:uncharacterized membrane protein